MVYLYNYSYHQHQLYMDPMCCWSTWSFWSQFFNSWPGQSVGPVLPLALLAHCITQKTGVRQELSNRHLSKLISCLAFDPSFWLFGFFSEVDNFMQRRTSAEKKILNLVCMFLYVPKRYMHPNGISKSTLVKLRRNTLQEFTSFPANVVFSVPSPFLKKKLSFGFGDDLWKFGATRQSPIPQLVNRRGASEKSQAAKDWLVVMFFLFHVDLIVYTTDSFSNVYVHM